MKRKNATGKRGNLKKPQRPKKRGGIARLLAQGPEEIAGPFDHLWTLDKRGWRVFKVDPNDAYGYCVCGHHFFDHGTPFHSGMGKYPTHLDPSTPPPSTHVCSSVKDGKGPCLIAWRWPGQCTCQCKGFKRAKNPKPAAVPPPPAPRKQTREALF